MKPKTKHHQISSKWIIQNLPNMVNTQAHARAHAHTHTHTHTQAALKQQICI